MDNLNEDYEFKKDIARMEYNKFKEKIKDVKPEDFTPELYIESLKVSYEAAQFPELVDFVMKQDKYGL